MLQVFEPDGYTDSVKPAPSLMQYFFVLNSNPSIFRSSSNVPYPYRTPFWGIFIMAHYGSIWDIRYGV